MYLGSNSCSGPLISKGKKNNVIKLYNLKIIQLTASFLSVFLSFSHFKREGFPYTFP